MPLLRLLGVSSLGTGCPALYETDIDALVVHGRSARDGTAVLVPWTLLSWAEPGTVLTIEQTEDTDTVLIAGDPVDEETREALLMGDDEAAVLVPATRSLTEHCLPQHNDPASRRKKRGGPDADR
ncbi:hypothetical protein [Nocardia salmonicida]|uniref:hypothetical protein n=1 Tax=Nocardia salmonicida TaxID=53431 RepID=UPI0037AF1A87